MLQAHKKARPPDRDLALEIAQSFYWGFFLLKSPITVLIGFCWPLVPWPFRALFRRPVARPLTSGMNFGSEVVPETTMGTAPMPATLAFNLNASSFEGLTTPAPVTTPMDGTVRLMLSARVPSGATRKLELRF